ncbi:tyrosine-protein kinase-like otk [Cydia amplana]|uniref:tyrosine-protein kinase-like otk n=1 Tax=Cydia amplana TaxID=1869771 RepID=UPI002FE5D9BF
MMCFLRAVLFLSLVLSGLHASIGSEGIDHHSGHRLHKHKTNRKHRATNEDLHFDPKPFSKKIELKTPGKIHCKVAGGLSPTVQWFLNSADALPEGVSSANGTLHVALADKRHVGNYTCRATDGNHTITAEIHLDVVVSPKVIEPLPDTEIHIGERQSALLNCRAIGDPLPTTHWVRNLTIINQSQDGVDIEGGVNATHARMLLLNNGSLWVRSARREDSDRYACTAGNAAGMARTELILTVHPGKLYASRYLTTVHYTDSDRYACTAGSAAGMARTELILTVHPEGYYADGGNESGAGRAVLVAAGVAAGYMLLVLVLMLYCRRRRRERRLRGEKIELEMAEGREKLVEEGADKPKTNGAPNGKLPHDRDSGADTSEVSAASRVSRRGFEHLAAPRTLLSEQIPLGRGEFGEVSLARLDVSALKRARSATANSAPRLRPVLVKALTSKDEAAGAEFRRQLELFGRVRHEGVARLLALCSDADPHLMILEHTDWPSHTDKTSNLPLKFEAEFRRQLELFGRVRHEGVARLLALCSDADPHLMILEHTDWPYRQNIQNLPLKFEAEFRRQLELFGRVRHEGVARLLALCSDADPHLMILEHTDWPSHTDKTSNLPLKFEAEFRRQLELFGRVWHEGVARLLALCSDADPHLMILEHTDWRSHTNKTSNLPLKFEAEFRRQLELFGRVRHEGVARLLALCSDADPHLMILEHTDWGDLKTFLQATTAEQTAQFTGAGGASAAPLSPQHQALLASQLAHAATALANQRLTHRDIAARNCAISSALRLKLTMAAMSRGPDTAHYYKRHDQVIPLRWLPAEAALEGEYSAKSDAYMFGATVWEIYTKAELPFAKLNDNSVLERLKSGTLEWTVPASMPDALAELLKRCWSNSPSERPQFEAICTEVDAVLQAVTAAETTQENSP